MTTPWRQLWITLTLAGTASAALAAPPLPPGVVIASSPASSRVYLGTPAIAVLPDGSYLAKHDEFGPGSTEHEVGVTHVYRSPDRGASWKRVSTVRGMYWAGIFTHRDATYLLGPDRNGGRLVIARSTDGGVSWTTPRDEMTGLLLAEGKYHTSATPVLLHRGRLWRAVEDTLGPGGWGSHFRAFVLSAPEDADLLRAESWTRTNALGRDPAWLDGKCGGWLEGNAVVDPRGSVVNLLRVDYRAGVEKAAIIEVSADGGRQSFDAAKGFIDFPGGCKKFTVRFDPPARKYWSLANHVPPSHRNANPERTRNTLALIASTDLRAWEVRCNVLHHPDRARHGFQYADWLFDGDDLIAVVRTAYDDASGGAPNQHDANFLTFHRIPRFRELTMADSAAGAPRE
jgi:hypothetical protein